MASPKPPSPLVQTWLVWLDRHCRFPRHMHLAYQCRVSCTYAIRGASHFEDPSQKPGPEPVTLTDKAWVEWLFRPCTVLGHNVHRRNLCRESREQALRGAVVEADPPQD
jgi:hypothetical protein